MTNFTIFSGLCQSLNSVWIFCPIVFPRFIFWNILSRIKFALHQRPMTLMSLPNDNGNGFRYHSWLHFGKKNIVELQKKRIFKDCQRHFTLILILSPQEEIALTMFLKKFFFRTFRQVSYKIGTKHSWVNGKKYVQTNDNSPFQGKIILAT